MTVIPEEFEAVRKVLPSLVKVPGSRTKRNIYNWHIGEIICVEGGAYRVAVGLIGRAGTNAAATALAVATKHFKPHSTILVGIAGGFEKDGLKHGDVVVADTIYGYEYGKLKANFEIRPNHTYMADVGLRNSAMGFAHKKGLVWTGLETSPKVLLGSVASGDKVIDNRGHEFFAEVAKTFPGLMAVEMEGAGAAEAGQHLNSSGLDTTFLMVRGISDMPPSQSGEHQQTVIRDKWKTPAASAAAQFVAQWIADGLPTSPGKKATPSVRQ